MSKVRPGHAGSHSTLLRMNHWQKHQAIHFSLFVLSCSSSLSRCVRTIPSEWALWYSSEETVLTHGSRVTCLCQRGLSALQGHVHSQSVSCASGSCVGDWARCPSRLRSTSCAALVGPWLRPNLWSLSLCLPSLRQALVVPEAARLTVCNSKLRQDSHTRLGHLPLSLHPLLFSGLHVCLQARGCGRHICACPAGMRLSLKQPCRSCRH